MLKEYHSIPIHIYACEILPGGDISEMKEKGKLKYIERGRGAAMTNIIFYAIDPVEPGDFIVMKDGEYFHKKQAEFNSEFYSQGKVMR